MEYFIPFLIIGAVLAMGLYALIRVIRNRNMAVTWYEWLIGIVGTLLLVIAVQHLFGAYSETFPFAAWLGFLIVGLPALILMAIAWQLVSSKNKGN